MNNLSMPLTHRSYRPAVRDILQTHRQRHDDSSKEAPNDSAGSLPTIGLIRRTVRHSPMVKWMFNARIRHSQLNDLIIVGEHHVEIRHIYHDDAGLDVRTVGATQSFDSSIRTAGVIGSALFIEQGLPGGINDPFDPNLRAESFPPNILVLGLADGNAVFLVAPTDNVATTVRFERSAIPLSGTSAFNQPFAIVTVDNSSRIIALAAHDGFVHLIKLKKWQEMASDFASGTWHPVEAQRPLFSHPFNGTILKMAFLPFTRGAPNMSQLALVASINHRPHLFVWLGDLFGGALPIQPIIRGRPLGDVDDDTKFNCAQPDLMVPFLHSSGFMLACGSSLYFYRIAVGDVITDTFETYPDEQRERFRIQMPEEFQTYPRITAFAHCVRGQTYQQMQKESFYLLRQDGMLLHAEFEACNRILGPLVRPAAKLDCYGSEAMTSFFKTGTLADPDLLAVAGDMSDGRMISFGESTALTRTEAMAPQIIQIMPNWSPTLDLCEVGSSGQGSNYAFDHTLFMIACLQPFGSLAQLCPGHMANVVVTTTIPDLEHLGPAHCMFINCADDSGVYHIIVALNTETLVLSGSVDDLSYTELEGRSLAIAFEDNVLLQIGPNSMTLLVLETISPSSVEEKARKTFGPSESIVLAASIPLTAAAVVVRRSLEGRVVMSLYAGTTRDVTLHEFEIQTVGDEVSDLGGEPTAICIVHFHNAFLAVVGISDGRLLVFRVDDQEGLTLITSFTYANIGSTPQSIVIESLCVLGHTSSNTFHVLCGLRDGNLLQAGMTITENGQSLNLHLGSFQSSQLGTHPVKVHSNPIHTYHAAYAVCDSTVVRISINAQHVDMIDIQRVWFQDDQDGSPGFGQPLDPVIAIVPTLAKRYHAPELLAVFSREGFFIADVEFSKEQLHVHKTALSLRVTESATAANDVMGTLSMEAGTPQKIIYVSTQNTLAIATLEQSLPSMSDRRNSTAWTMGRTLSAYVIFVLLETRHQEQNWSVHAALADPRSCTRLKLGSFECVTCMCEWSWDASDPGDPMQSQHKQHLMLATRIKTSDSEMGKLYFVKVQRDGQGYIECSVMKDKVFHRPILAMAPINNTKLLVADAEELQVYGPDVDENGKSSWRQWTQHSLTDIPRHVTVKYPLLYVTGSHRSMTAFKYCQGPIDGKETIAVKVVKCFGDEMARPTINHLLLSFRNQGAGMGSVSQPRAAADSAQDELQLILLATQDNKLAVVSHPHDSDMATHFRNCVTMVDANVPQLINHLAISPLRPPWLRHLEHPPGVIGPDIIGTSPAGAISHIRLLNSQASQLLLFLQNLVKYQNAGRELRRINAMFPQVRRATVKALVIDPLWFVPEHYLDAYHSRRGRLWDGDHEDSNSHASEFYRHVEPREMAVDGDLLEDFIDEKGPISLLERLLQKTWELDSTSDAADAAERNGNALDKRVRRFQAIVDLLLGPASSEILEDFDYIELSIKDEDTIVINEFDPQRLQKLRLAVVRCVQWLRKLWKFY